MPEVAQRGLALLLAIATAPLQAVLAILVRLESPGGALFLPARVGEGGRLFRVMKLRTMRPDAALRGSGVTIRRDPRVTRLGGFLRAFRLDELPQLWNVVRGEMLLVGPRPEDPRYVDRADPLHRRVFTAKPGITGLTQLAYADEGAMLDPDDPDAHYRAAILPAKLAMDARYLDARSAGLDAWILLQTIRTALGDAPPLREVEARLDRASSARRGARSA